MSRLALLMFCALFCGLNCVSYRREKRFANPLWNETSLDKLRNDLLMNYDKFSKSDNGNTTEVTIGLTIVYLETDELNSTFSVSMWLRMSWNDPKLRWNSRDYSGIETLKLADHEIWQPDIYLFNSANSGGDPIIRYGNPHAIVHPNGKVVWVPPIRVNALCEFDMYYWPFDVQECYLRFGSGTRTRNDIRLKLSGVQYKENLALSQWTIASRESIVETTRLGYPEDFFHALYNLTLTRKSSTSTTVAATVIFCVTSLVLSQKFMVQKKRKGTRPAVPYHHSPLRVSDPLRHQGAAQEIVTSVDSFLPGRLPFSALHHSGANHFCRLPV